MAKMVRESFKALKEAKGFKASLARIGVAALVGIGGIALVFGCVGGAIWFALLPETHPFHQVLLVAAPLTFALSMIAAVTLIAHIILFLPPSQKG